MRTAESILGFKRLKDPTLAVGEFISTRGKDDWKKKKGKRGKERHWGPRKKRESESDRDMKKEKGGL